MRDHKRLRAFELADQLAMLTYKQTARLPKDELFGLVSQMRRAAVSVASNIVEGCSRNSTVEYLRFLEVAYGSARELEYQISVAERLYADCASNESEMVPILRTPETLNSAEQFCFELTW
jgi:four helix bundle protein